MISCATDRRLRPLGYARLEYACGSRATEPQKQVSTSILPVQYRPSAHAYPHHSVIARSTATWQSRCSSNAGSSTCVHPHRDCQPPYRVRGRNDKVGTHERPSTTLFAILTEWGFRPFSRKEQWLIAWEMLTPHWTHLFQRLVELNTNVELDRIKPITVGLPYLHYQRKYLTLQ